VAVEKLLPPKFAGDPRKSFVGHPNAILFLRISREGIFQQLQAITLKTRSMSVMAILRQQSVAPCSLAVLMAAWPRIIAQHTGAEWMKNRKLDLS
jgi:hypothetical protein